MLLSHILYYLKALILISFSPYHYNYLLLCCVHCF